MAITTFTLICGPTLSFLPGHLTSLSYLLPFPKLTFLPRVGFAAGTVARFTLFFNHDLRVDIERLGIQEPSSAIASPATGFLLGVPSRGDLRPAIEPVNGPAWKTVAGLVRNGHIARWLLRGNVILNRPLPFNL